MQTITFKKFLSFKKSYCIGNFHAANVKTKSVRQNGKYLTEILSDLEPEILDSN